MNWFVNPGEERLKAGWRLLLQFALMIFFLGLGYWGIQSLVREMSFLLNVCLSLLAYTLSAWIATRYLDNRSFRSLGLHLDAGWFRELGVGFLIAALVMAFIFLVELATGWIRFTGFGWERAWSVPYPLPLLGYLAGMLMVGFYEELVFRGYQITNMVEGFSGEHISPLQAVGAAILLSSSIFGILHSGNPNASVVSTINIMMAGVVLAVPYLLTGRLGLSVGLHAGWNFLQGGIFGFPVSGSPSRSSLLQIRETGPDIFTGGSFGPEAGLMGIVGLILILVLCYLYVLKSRYRIGLSETFLKRDI